MNDQLDFKQKASGIVSRAKAILIDPHAEWQHIATEQTSIREVLLGYVLPLAAIGPVASFIGGQLFGYGALGFNARVPLLQALGAMVTAYAMGLVMLGLLSAITNILAPKFAGAADSTAAFKLVAYSFTAAWVASGLSLLSLEMMGAILGLYSIYLFHAGAGPMLKVPQDKAVAFTAVVFVAAIVTAIIVGRMLALVG